MSLSAPPGNRRRAPCLSTTDMQSRHRRRRRPIAAALLLPLALLAAFAAGCSAGDAAGWREVDGNQLDAAGRQQLERATAARDALGRQLLTELQTALADGGPAHGIAVCRNRAPAIAHEVSTARDVRIGRTSFRLRNPDNAAPEWAAATLAARPDAPTLLRGPAERLGALFPIRLQPQCVMCHGTEDQIAPAAREALQAHYRDDAATGFAPGELRGWFWVEVP